MTSLVLINSPKHQEKSGADEGILLINGAALRGVLDWRYENAPNGEKLLLVTVRPHAKLKSFGAEQRLH